VQPVSAVIAKSAFHPVFQPVFDLATQTIVGYEVLARFNDGTAGAPRALRLTRSMPLVGSAE
jgi:EAL domain-containing protein (putative c-di-GMP-specific phosphodiesterase class I)